MIQSIHIRNFRNIRSADIDLERLTVFVGANAVGKSSVLEAVQHCTAAAGDDPANYFRFERHCDWLYTRGGAGDLTLECDTTAGKYGISASIAEVPDYSRYQPEDIGKMVWSFATTPSDDQRRFAAIGAAAPVMFLKLNATQLAKESYSESVKPRLEFDGSRLASVMAYLKLTDDSAFEKIQETIREFVPQFRRIRIQRRLIRKEETEFIRIEDQSVPRRSIRSYQGEALLFDFANAQNIPARAVSEGTLLLLGLLTVLHGPEQPNVLLMDDIDQGLHPLAQRKLLQVLAQLMAEYPKLQVLATSHSPYLLDGLLPEQVRCMTTDPEGYTVVNKLGDHPEFAKWQDELAPGEMWSMFGEKWMPRKGVDP
jgi:predicted ATPase